MSNVSAVRNGDVVRVDGTRAVVRDVDDSAEWMMVEMADDSGEVWMS